MNEKPKDEPIRQEELVEGVQEMATERNPCYIMGHERIKTYCTVAEDGNVFLYQKCMDCGILYKGFNEVNQSAIKRVIADLEECLRKINEAN